MGIIQKILKIINRVTSFITKDVWSVRLDDYPKHIAVWLKYLRVLLVSLRRYNEDRVQLRASSLTYYTLMAIVPILAMGFGIAKGFGFDKDLEQKLIDNFKGQEEVLNWIISFAHNMLDNTKGGLIAGIGLVFLFWSVIKMMGNIESSLNDIWKVSKNRTYVRKFTDYFSMMLAAPIIIILISSGTVYITTQLNQIASGINLVNLSPIVVLLMQLFPLIITWTMFTLVYIIMPNTKVKLSSAILAGVLAGTAFLLVLWFYIYAQKGMSRYNVIYGSFAALPLLLIWIRTSWLIVLLGAEISYARQNIDKFELENESLQISDYAHRAYSILLLENIVSRFLNGDKPIDTNDMAKNMKLPVRLLSSVISDLLESKLILEVTTNDEKVRAYVPSKDIKKYTIKYVFEALDKCGNNCILNAPSNQLKRILQIQEKFLHAIEQVPDNILIQDINSLLIDDLKVN